MPSLTRAWPAGRSGHRGRIDRALVDAAAWPPQARRRTYVCGPTAVVEAAAELDALDGNAIAGELFAAFGHEMTTVVGTCTSCGAARFSGYELSMDSRGDHR